MVNIKTLETRMAPVSAARTICEQIADTIAKDIAHGNYRANEKLSEVELASRFGVSRGPVRDALDLLERNMLVTIKPRSYTRVNRLTVQELEQLFTYRRHVLGLAAQFAARFRTEDDLITIKSGLDNLEMTLTKDNLNMTQLAFPATQLWDLIIAASHSHIVNQSCMHFTGSNIWSTAVQEKISDSSIPLYKENRLKLWRKLFRAIAKGNESSANKAGEALVKDNWDFLEDVFKQYFPAD